MIATVGRGSAQPAPPLSPRGTGAPQFAVQFSRPGASSGRSNAFRWTGPGTIHVLESGLLVATRRRSPLGFKTADERFVPASEIFEVCREGDSVRVDLRGGAQPAAFFQFWTGNPAVAGTIVRLLPTTRTIEYETVTGERLLPSYLPSYLPSPRRRSRRRLVSTALLVGLVSVACLLATDIVLHRTSSVPAPISLPTPIVTPSPATVAVPAATAAEVASAREQLRRFDDRMEGLRTQYRMAFEALQSGKLSQDDFIDGIHEWLIPQWRTLYAELAADSSDRDELNSVLRKRLIGATLGWDRGLQDYAAGLQTHSYAAVMAAFERMSDGNEARREAWKMLDLAQNELTAPPKGTNVSASPTASSPHRP